MSTKAKRAALASAALLLALATASQAEVTQRGSLRVSFGGKIAPYALPRSEAAPVSVSLSGDITTTDHSIAPQLRTIEMAINRNGKLDSKGLPKCHYRQLQPASTEEAKAACPGALVGTGLFEADVALPEQSPFPSNGKILAFNGTLQGRPAIFAHIYGTEPLPTSFTLPFEIERHDKGTFATTLTAQMPRVAAQWGSISGVSLNLHRTYRYRGKARSYVSAGCPAPKGFPGASFTFARATFRFEGGRVLSSAMARSCRVANKRS